MSSFVSYESDIQDARFPRKKPLVILCQGKWGGCGSCCGADNFKDNSHAARHRRFKRRTEAVMQAWPHEKNLEKIKIELHALEVQEILDEHLSVCPFAGYLVERIDDIQEISQLGCMIHPLRHPEGKDLRDLSPFGKEVCGGYYCVAHDLLSGAEKECVFHTPAQLYPMVATNIALLRGFTQWMGISKNAHLLLEEHKNAWVKLCEQWLEWPWKDDNPKRFGASMMRKGKTDQPWYPNTMVYEKKGYSKSLCHIVDGMGTRLLDDEEWKNVVGIIEEIRNNHL